MFNILLIFLLFSPFCAFNISNINDFSKLSILDKIKNFSKTATLYTLNSNKNIDIERNELYDDSTKSDNNIKLDEHHKLDNSLFFDSPVTEESAIALEQQLLNLNKLNLQLKKHHNIDNGPINLHIRSFGGSLFHTLYLIDLIKNLDTPVYTYIDGFAASAATLLSVVGKKRFMTKHSIMLIHQLSSGSSGKYSELKDEEQNIDMLMDMIVEVYLEHTKIDKMTLNNLLKHDWWLDSAKCLKLGLVDEII